MFKSILLSIDVLFIQTIPSGISCLKVTVSSEGPCEARPQFSQGTVSHRAHIEQLKVTKQL